MVSSLQFISHLSASSVDVPYNTLYFQEKIAQVSKFNYFKPFNMSTTRLAKGISYIESRRRDLGNITGPLVREKDFYLEKLGYNSKNAVLEMGSIFFFTFFLLAFIFFMFLLKLIVFVTQFDL